MGSKDSEIEYVEEPEYMDGYFYFVQDNIILICLWLTIIITVITNNLIGYFIIAIISMIILELFYTKEEKSYSTIDKFRNYWRGIFVIEGKVGNFKRYTRKDEIETAEEFKIENIDEIRKEKGILGRDLLILHAEDKELILNTKNPERLESLLVSKKI